MFDKDTLVSVIVPVYNTDPYLAQCLDSILAQSHGRLEVVVLDDGSTDGSPAIMDAYAARDDRVRVIHKHNEGYGATCNRGLREASGDWVAIVEPDDWIEPAMYGRMLAFAGTLNGRIDVVKTPYWRIIDADTPEQLKLNCSYRRRVRPPRQPFSIGEAPRLLTHHPSIWSALYRRGFLEEFGIAFHEIPGAGWADNPFLIDTLCQARGIAYLDEPFYCYREETDEKFAASTRANPMLAFDRWQDMCDSLEHIGVVDEGVWRAHASRGFTYLSGVLASVGADRDDVREAMTAMFSRMDPNLVLTDSRIPPECRRLFCETMGLPAPKTHPLRYAGRLVGEGLYTLANTSPAFTLRQTKRFLRNRQARDKA
ncbi:glycosyltransferase [Eggerthellaceae bacterium zg-893]|nr:glycosyltransferase [Eggerthellaceae bacterium zg-893]